MDPKFNTSFIPKKPLVTSSGSAPSHKNSTNIFNTIASALFVLTLIAYGGAYFYRNLLLTQIDQAGKDLNDARAAFELDKIQSLIDANARINSVDDLLGKHIVASEMLGLFQKLTLKKMHFNTLTYKNNGGSPTISIDGEVQTYNALAEQSDTFSKSEFIKNQQFSNFSLADNGNIRVTFFANLDPGLTSYKKLVEALNTTQ